MMSALVHAHDSRVHFKLDEIAKEVQELGAEIQASKRVLDDARLTVAKLHQRRRVIAEQVAILREMLGIR